MKLKSILKGTKGMGLFAGGAVFAEVARKVAGTESARRLYVSTLAKGMHLVDGVNDAVSNVKQEAEDIYEEAKDVYAQEKQATTIQKVEQIKATDE